MNLDVDGDGAANALTDGIVIVRYLFGLRGEDLVGPDVSGSGATRTTPEAVEAFLAEGLSTMLDPDANGTANALTDGILIVRYLFGLTGDDLIGGNVIAEDATRRTAEEIEPFLAAFLPARIPAASAGLPAAPGANLLFPDDDPGPIDRLNRWLCSTEIGPSCPVSPI